MITDEDPLRGMLFNWDLSFSHTLHVIKARRRWCEHRHLRGEGSSVPTGPPIFDDADNRVSGPHRSCSPDSQRQARIPSAESALVVNPRAIRQRFCRALLRIVRNRRLPKTIQLCLYLSPIRTAFHKYGWWREGQFLSPCSSGQTGQTRRIFFSNFSGPAGRAAVPSSAGLFR